MKPKLKLRSILTFLGVVGLIILIVVDRRLFVSFWQILKTVRWYVIPLMVAIELCSFYLNAIYYRSILRIFSYDVGIKRLFEGALATNFVNYVLPTAGMAGAGYMSQVLHPEVPRGKGVLTQFMRYALSALAVLIMMPIGILIIFSSHQAQHPVIRAAILSAISITIFAFIIVGFVEQEKLIRRFVSWLDVRYRHRFPNVKDRSFNRFADDFYVGYHTMTRQKVRMLIPFGWSIIYIIAQVLMLYVGFLAVGRTINFGVAIMAYLFGNIVSIFGGVFFSTGTFELGMSGTLVALGQPLALALAVTTLYRAISLLAGLPLGFYYYRKYLPE